MFEFQVVASSSKNSGARGGGSTFSKLKHPGGRVGSGWRGVWLTLHPHEAVNQAQFSILTPDENIIADLQKHVTLPGMVVADGTDTTDTEDRVDDELYL
jgi:hypothetical protein